MLTSTYQDLVFLVRHRPGKQKTGLRIQVSRQYFSLKIPGFPSGLQQPPSAGSYLQVFTSGLLSPRPSASSCSSVFAQPGRPLLSQAAHFRPVCQPACRPAPVSIRSVNARRDNSPFIEAEPSLSKGIPSQVRWSRPSFLTGANIPILVCPLFNGMIPGFLQVSCPCTDRPDLHGVCHLK